MADALLSPVVGTVMWAASAGFLAYGASKIKKDELGEKKLPLMGIAGAFIFAAQMINFTIPATGSSGHIGGGILLAGLLGRFPALLAIGAVLIIQALFFADGGLLALGCNIFNLGVIPCLLIYPLVFKPILKRGINFKNITLASIFSVILGLQLGSLGVVLQTLASGITELPFATFLAVMQPIHLAIGLVEGIVTAGILTFVYSMRPEILESTQNNSLLNSSLPMKKILGALVALTLVVGGGLSLLASAYPDGLEWSMTKVAGTAELETEGEIFEEASNVQQTTAFMPDYALSGDSASETSLAGIVGSLITFGVALGAGLLISNFKKRKKV